MEETLYKLVEYKNILYQIPIRKINQDKVILFSDIQDIFPKATALLSCSKLIPFQLDVNLQEIIPKRVLVSDSTIENIWEIHVPEYDSTNTLMQTTIEMQIKMDQLSEKLDKILLQQHQESLNNMTMSNAISSDSSSSTSSSSSNNNINNNDSNGNRSSQHSLNNDSLRGDHIEDNHQQLIDIQQHGDADIEEDNEEEEHNDNPTTEDEIIRSDSPPPAFSIPSTSHEAPPSYETSVLSSIKLLNSKIRLYESHINNRHKSPKWLSKRQAWLAREPDSIDQVAFQLVQLEMALLWTAVSEAWIEERETWLTLVSSARSERHLAGALVDLERHTLVMDEEWTNVRERWISDLLELIILPLSHG
ncbi:uncharacterized protein RHIMIDRAFT_237329 [Rhizopus microsporus ATCC 52813]|uniref:Uncharacterized protein n=1 Tax=Rhizopus microsporus ATCC 52813 TaxID=1340429 RepID=A0A2G4SUE1_RHIZD|nr:uncharacterized protein RHIMIDRAFT_237329 [Rhizopus microsporus ATCC 52813]PHZ12398.1 hypothetical protein RHIMIDRAFT_237329 [Rhizopus microsporus ATCC 52813]